MTFNTTKELFERAAKLAQDEENQYGETIALALLDLTKSVQASITQLTNKIDEVEQRVRAIR